MANKEPTQTPEFHAQKFEPLGYPTGKVIGTRYRLETEAFLMGLSPKERSAFIRAAVDAAIAAQNAEKC